jgi:enamine deaminase RidA (YjgF/YER057c/UK114 family)
MKRVDDTQQPELLLPEGWARPTGYAQGATARGRCLFTAGQVGWNPLNEKFESTDLVPQVEQALRNVVAVLKNGGAEPCHLVRLTWFMTNKADYLAYRREIGSAYLEVMGKHYPAMTLIFVNDLLEEDAKVEIEAVAIVPE